MNLYEATAAAVSSLPDTGSILIMLLHMPFRIGS